MTQKLWQKNLKLNYNKEVVDIVQFGSSVMEGKEARDIDIAVIFDKISLKEQIDGAYKIKKQIEKLTDKEIHISNFDLSNLFNEGNFAREGILFYGISLINGEAFSKKLGFSPKIQILYSLEKLKKKDKVRFHYMLRGKKGKYGMLRKYDGELVSSGVIEISPAYEELFVNEIKNFISDFKIRRILIS